MNRTGKTLRPPRAVVLEDCRTGKCDALAKAFPAGTTAERLGAFEAEFRKKRYAGPTIVAVAFARGTAHREYLWSREGTIVDLGPLVESPWGRLFPEPDAGLAMVGPATAEVSRIRFEKRDGGGVVATVEHGRTRVELKKD